jgi:hypothetical protein
MQEPAITPTLLAEAGVNVPDDQVPELLDHLNATLEERIGEEITNALDDEKLAELVELQKTADDEKIGAWLQANVAELNDIIQDEIDILMGEVSENADQFSQK